MKRGLRGLARGGFDPDLFAHQLTYRQEVIAHGRVPSAPRPPAVLQPARKRRKEAKRPVVVAVPHAGSEAPPGAEIGWTCPFCQRQNVERRPVAAGSMTCKHCGRFVPVDHID